MSFEYHVWLRGIMPTLIVSNLNKLIFGVKFLIYLITRQTTQLKLICFRQC